MREEKRTVGQETISMEEYLWKRQKIREQEDRKQGFAGREEKRTAWMLAELYV